MLRFARKPGKLFKNFNLNLVINEKNTQRRFHLKQISKRYFSKPSEYTEGQKELNNFENINDPKISWKDYSKIFSKITKTRLSVMNAGMVAIGYQMVSSDPYHTFLIFGTSFMTSCVLQAMGQVYEIQKDAKMKRTANRPLVTGKISPKSVSLVSFITFIWYFVNFFYDL